MRLQLLLIAAVVGLNASSVSASDTTNESRLADKVELFGGRVKRGTTQPGHPVVTVTFQGSARFSEKYLHLLKQFTNLTTLEFDNTQITDAGLKELSELKHLTTLYLNNTQITDNGLLELEKLKSLTTLSLFNSRITDGGLANLRSLKNLTILSLGSN